MRTNRDATRRISGGTAWTSRRTPSEHLYSSPGSYSSVDGLCARTIRPGPNTSGCTFSSFSSRILHARLRLMV
jgi:hypothetical protein